MMIVPGLIVINGHVVRFTGEVTVECVARRQTPSGAEHQTLAHIEGFCVGCGLLVVCTGKERREELKAVGYHEIQVRSEASGQVAVVFPPVDVLATFVPIEEPG